MTNAAACVALAGLTLVTACPPANEPSSENAASSTSPRSRDDGALGPVERVEQATTAHMAAHFGDVLEIHTSLIHGSLDDARKAAVDLAEDRPSVVLEDWAPYLLTMRGAAEDLGRARSVDEASRLAATLAKSCGDCHEAQGVHLPNLAGASPPKTDDRGGRMQRHAWAFNRLWEGLVLPSDESWTLGVSAFVELPECEDHLSAEADRNAIARAREIVAATENAARSATSREARAQVYGQMLPTCAACHASGC